MVVGFNHNFNYKGETYHVQTEDAGLRNPYIITLLYRGGTILASKKTSYGDIVKVDNLEKVVEELMKEQHREMLRLLKDGAFDAKISAGGVSAETRSTSGKGQISQAAAPNAGKMKASQKTEHDIDEILRSYLMGEEEEP